MQQKPAPPTSSAEPQQDDPAVESNPTKFVQDATNQVPPQMHHSNSNMPPQQVYVSSGEVTGLESQFQNMGIQQGVGAMNGHHHHAEGEGEGNEEGEEGDDDPLKLFVGQVSDVLKVPVYLTTALVLELEIHEINQASHCFNRLYGRSFD